MASTTLQVLAHGGSVLISQPPIGHVILTRAAALELIGLLAGASAAALVNSTAVLGEVRSGVEVIADRP